MNRDNGSLDKKLIDLDDDSLLSIFLTTDPQTVFNVLWFCFNVNMILSQLYGDFDAKWTWITRNEFSNESEIACGSFHNIGLLGALKCLKYVNVNNIVLSCIDSNINDPHSYISKFLDDLIVARIETFTFHYNMFTTKILSNISPEVFKNLVQLYSSILHLVGRLGVMGCFDMYKIFCPKFMNVYIISVKITTYILYERLEYVFAYIAGIIQVLQQECDGKLINVCWTFGGFQCADNTLEMLQVKTNFEACAGLIQPLQFISKGEVLATARADQQYKISIVDNPEEHGVSILFRSV
uniref:HORMA domain-containing protein n=1 Tax=Syphacia muris TaxID=451379 RepID=A0A0N5APL4_9BILA